jgi:hypothetical protein
VDAEHHSDREPLGKNLLEVALSVLTDNVEAADRELEARVTERQAQNPKHWSNFRLVVAPWQEQSGQLRGVAATVKRLARDRPAVGQPLYS